MAESDKAKIVIKGVTTEGKQFRPSDWAERMSGRLSTVRNHRLYYSPLLRPAVREGNKCVIVDPALKKTNPKLYQSIMDFAASHHLEICQDMDSQNNEDNQ